MTKIVSAHIFVLLALIATAVLLALPHSAHAALTDGLVGHWTFDGPDVTTTVTDRSGQGNNGYFIGGATSSAKTIGKLGQAFSFDGSDDFVRIAAGDGSAYDFAASLFTLSAWVKTSSSGVGKIINASDGGDLYYIETNAGQAHFFYSPGDSGSDLSAGTVNDGQWHHIVGIRTGARTGQLFIDGIVVATDSDTSGSLSGVDITSNLFVGEESDSTDRFPGSIDDVRIYNRALTASEVKQLYNKGQALKKPPNNLGLVGYWSFNEGTGTIATDFSGNGNHGTTTGNPTWVIGKRSKALQFDAVNDQVDMGVLTALSGATKATLAGWVYRANTTDSVEFGQHVEGDRFAMLWDTDGTVYNSAENGGASYPNFSSNATGWHHYVMVYDGTQVGLNRLTIYFDNATKTLTAGGSDPAASLPSGVNQSTFKVGMDNQAGTERFWGGRVDDIRVYNRALSASEVTALYGSGAVKFTTSSVELQRGSTLASGLVGHWTFDGPDVTTTVTDRSGEGNNGYFIGGATSSAKTIGKLGQALSFDGSNDYLSVASSPVSNLAGSSSGCTWVKNTDITSFPGGVAQTIFIFADGSSNVVRFGENNISGASSEDGTVYVAFTGASKQWETNQVLFNNVWTHLCYTYDGTTGLVYVNGQNVSAPCCSSFGLPTNNRVGARDSNGAGAWNGIIDDVRIYNRTLTASEVKQLYNLGQATITN